MKQFLLPAEAGDDNRIEVQGKRAHYLTRVRRLGPGDGFTAAAPSGKIYDAVIEIADDVSVWLKLNPLEDSAGPVTTDSPDITLYQGLPKGQKMDLIIRMATEAGISSLVPVSSKHCVTILQGDKEEKKIERWQRIAREALQQSGSRLFTTVKPKQYLEEITPPEEGVGLVLHQEPLAQEPLHRYLSGYPRRISLLVGPEGGFAPEEIESLKKRGWNTFCLGPRVLRTETAGLYALAAVHTILMENEFWTYRQQAPGYTF